MSNKFVAVSLWLKELGRLEPDLTNVLRDLVGETDVTELQETVRQIREGYERPLNMSTVILERFHAKYPGLMDYGIELLGEIEMAELKKAVVPKAVVPDDVPPARQAAAPLLAPPSPSESCNGRRELIGIDWAFSPPAADWTISPLESWAEPTYILPPLPRNASRAVKHPNRMSYSSDPADRLVDAGKALVRLLRVPFNESILAQEGNLEFHQQYNADGHAFLSDDYLEATLTYRDHNVRFVILDKDYCGKQFVKLCARFESGLMIKGRAILETWQRIVDAVKIEARQPPPARPAWPPLPPDEGPWDEKGHRIGGPRTPPRFPRPPDDRGSGWAA